MNSIRKAFVNALRETIAGVDVITLVIIMMFLIMSRLKANIMYINAKQYLRLNFLPWTDSYAYAIHVTLS